LNVDGRSVALMAFPTATERRCAPGGRDHTRGVDTGLGSATARKSFRAMSSAVGSPYPCHRKGRGLATVSLRRSRFHRDHRAGKADRDPEVRAVEVVGDREVDADYRAVPAEDRST